MVLRLHNVRKHYTVAERRIPALDGVTLRLDRSEYVALVGRSGCGKTTLLNLAGAADLPSGGEVEIEGVRTSSLDDDALTRLRRTRIGFVFQFLQLLPSLSAVENVELPLQLAGVRKTRSRALRMMELAGVADLAGRQPYQLSGGQMQCVAIARALVHEPSLLLADEPTGRLDTQTSETVMGLLLDVRRQLGTGILMATHSPASAAVADRRLVLSNGRLVRGDSLPPEL